MSCKNLLFLFLCFASYGFAQTSVALKKASLRPQWVPQTQFAGYYVAAAKGFYKQHGIDLEIRAGGPGIIATNNVAKNTDTFGTDWLMPTISAVAKGAPLVNIGQMLQTSGLMLVTKRSTQITEPKMMNKRSVGVWPGSFSFLPNMLFKKFDVAPHLISQKFSIDDFLNNKLEVASAMVYNEYPLMLESGLKPDQLTVFHYRDYDLNIPEDGVYVHKKTLEQDPELCKSFIKASIQGWIYAFDNEEEAVDIVMAEAKKHNTGTTREHQMHMLKEIKKLMLYQITPDKIGELKESTFDFVYKKLKEMEPTTGVVNWNTFYRSLNK